MPKMSKYSTEDEPDESWGPTYNQLPSGTRIYIGIDPGQAGGIVGIQLAESYSGIVENIYFDPMPDTERNVWELLDGYRGSIAIIEKVHSMPKQGVASSFSFGMGYGGLRMALIAAGIPFEEITPQKWQKALGVVPAKKTESKSDFKNRLLAMAQQLYPQLPIWKEPRSKGKQLAICDALLIARYCQLKCEGRL
jgi:crossover junction endodeoxyribonuclease RuvC